MNTFVLLGERFEAPPAEILAPLLGEILGLLPYEAARAAASAGGILAEGLEEEKAERLAGRLGEAGFPCRVVPAPAAPPQGPVRTAREIRLLEDSLQFRPGFTGPWISSPWKDLLLLSAGVILEVEGGGFRSTGKKGGGGVGVGGAVRLMVDPVGGALSILKKARKKGGLERRPGVPFPHPLADLYFQGEGEGAGWIRVRAREVRFSGPGEKEVRGDFYARFLAFLGEAARRSAPEEGPPRLTQPSLALLGEGPEGVPLEGEAFFGEEQAFRRYNRWALACVLSESL